VKPTQGPARLPTYKELPLHLGLPVSWNLFGDEDSLGMLNTQTEERIARAAGLVTKGKLFALDRGTELMAAGSLFNRGTPRHRVFRTPSGALDDVLDNYYPQGSSQWDSLAHVPAFPDLFYNAVGLSEVLDAGRCCISAAARKGIAGRGVLVDLGRMLYDRWDGYCPGESYAISVDEVQDAVASAKQRLETGDVLLIRTGWIGWYESLPLARRQDLARAGNLKAVGLEHSERMAEYLWDSHVAAVAADCPALEVWPPDHEKPFGFLHHALIGRLGIMLGELWWLDALAADCLADGKYECFVVSAPWNVPRGIGSPANALAFK